MPFCCLYIVERGCHRKVGRSASLVSRMCDHYTTMGSNSTVYIFQVKDDKKSERVLLSWLRTKNYREENEILHDSLTEEQVEEIKQYMRNLSISDGYPDVPIVTTIGRIKEEGIPVGEKLSIMSEIEGQATPYDPRKYIIVVPGNSPGITWGLGTIINNINSKKIIVHSEIQRGIKWDLRRANNFLYNILHNIVFMDAIHIAIRKENGKGKKGEMIIVDGQHRITVLYNFCRGTFMLTLDNGQKVGIQDLEEDFRTLFEGTGITIVNHGVRTDAEIAELFFRLHDSVAVMPSDDIRVIASTYPIAGVTYELACRLDHHYASRFNPEHSKRGTNNVIDLNAYYNTTSKTKGTLREWLFPNYRGGAYSHQIITFQDIMDHICYWIHYLATGEKRSADCKKENISYAKRDDNGSTWFDRHNLRRDQLHTVDELFEIFVKIIDDAVDRNGTTLEGFTDKILSLEPREGREDKTCSGITRKNCRCTKNGTAKHIASGNWYCKQHVEQMPDD